MKIENPDHKSPTKADVFVETRKRKEGHEYKTSNEVLKFRLSKIKEFQQSGGNVEPLISGDKSHADSWLIGRHVNAKKVKKNAKQVDPTKSDDYVSDLTTKIRVQLEAEMEEKVNQKVQENLAFMLNKLGEANPTLKVNLLEVLGNRSSSSCNNQNLSSPNL